MSIVILVFLSLYGMAWLNLFFYIDYFIYFSKQYSKMDTIIHTLWEKKQRLQMMEWLTQDHKAKMW